MTRARLNQIKSIFAGLRHGPVIDELLTGAEEWLVDSERLNKLEAAVHAKYALSRGVELRGLGCIRTAIDGLPASSEQDRGFVKSAALATSQERKAECEK